MGVVNPIPITLDKERHLKFTLGGMKAFQQATGKSFLKGQVDVNNMDEADVIAFLWSCLIWEDRNLKLDDIGYMIDPSNLKDIITALAQATNTSLPDKKEDESPNPQSLPNS